MEINKEVNSIEYDITLEQDDAVKNMKNQVLTVKKQRLQIQEKIERTKKLINVDIEAFINVLNLISEGINAEITSLQLKDKVVKWENMISEVNLSILEEVYKEHINMKVLPFQTNNKKLGS